MGGYSGSVSVVYLLLSMWVLANTKRFGIIVANNVNGHSSSHRPFTISILAHWRDTQVHFLRKFQGGQISIMPPLAIDIFGFGSVTRSMVRGYPSTLVLSSLTFKSGEAFRFKPDGVLFNSPSAYRTIYQTKANVKKGKFYEIWSRNPQNISTLNMVDKMGHARKRRVLNSAFSETAIRSAETFVVKHVDRWNELIIDGNDGKEWTAPQNVSNLADYLVFDIMGDLCFGTSFDLKEVGENRFRHMPHNITDFMQFMYPVRIFRNKFPSCANKT